MNTSNNSSGFVEVFPITDPPYMSVYEWEQIELTASRQWVGKHWKLSVYASIVYVILIHAAQHWMKNREPYNLRSLLLTWNVGLSIFSIIGFLRTAPELFHLLKEPTGFYLSICTR